MKLPSKYLSNLVIANLLWSFIPIVVMGLFSEISILTIIFLRFFFSGIALFVIAISLVIINNYLNNDKKISLKELFLNLRHKNKRFYRIRQYNYYFLIGFFGIILHILFYFLALKRTSIPFAMIGTLMTIVFISLYEKGVNYEKFDIFRILFIVMLFFSILIITSVSLQGAEIKSDPIDLLGFIYLVLYSITGSFLYISIDRDSFSKKELINLNINKYYKIPRALIKMAIVFLSGVLLLIPASLLIAFLPFETDITQEAIAFFDELGFIFVILERWEIIYLIIFATILPYLLIFLARVNWKSENLTYSQWSSILNLIDPMGLIIFSVLIVNEYFPYDLLIITIFLLIITIVFRYAHETKNLVKAYLLITLRKGKIKPISLRILKYYGVTSVNALIGTYDLLVDVKISSIKDFYSLVNKRLKPIDEIKKIEIIFINKIEKIST